MILVLDASAAVSVITAEVGSLKIRAMLRDATPIAPELILAEVANSLWRKARLGALTATEAQEALPRLAELVDPLVPLHDLAAQALDLALRRDHPVYDCYYVALAMRQAAPLATGDRRLAERFAGDADIRLIS